MRNGTDETYAEIMTTRPSEKAYFKINRIFWNIFNRKIAEESYFVASVATRQCQPSKSDAPFWGAR